MAKKILDISAEINQGPLGWLNYEAVQQSNAGFIRTDQWEFKFVNPAPAVYYPGNDFLKTRLKGCTVNTEDGAIGQLSTNIRGFQVEQPIGQGAHNGTFTLDLQDFEDQSIIVWLWDWYCKIRDPHTNFSFQKADVVADAQFIVYSGNRIPIRRYDISRCYPTNTGDWINFSGTSEEPTDSGAFSVTFNAENIKMTPLTIA